MTTKIRLVASRNASRRSPRSSFSVNTGTKAAWIAASANRLRTRFGTWKAIVNADIAPLTPKYEAAKISRTRPAIRESAVAKEKNAVESASRPARGRRDADLLVWHDLGLGEVGELARRTRLRSARSVKAAPL